MENFIVDTIKPGIQFINGIKPRDKVAIVYGHDNDTICSAAIIYKLLKQLHGIESSLVVSGLNSEVTESVVGDVKRLGANHVIIVDIGSVGVHVMTGLRSMSNVLIIDHHVPKGYVKVAYVNPRVYDKNSYIPATYLCYKIYENYFDVNDILWVAGVGTLSDMGLKNCMDLFDAIKKDCGELVGDNENVDEVLFDNSLLGKLAKLCDSGRVVKGIEGVVIALDAVVKSKDYKEILEGKSAVAKKLLENYSLSEKEFLRVLKDFEKKKRRVKKSVVYEVRSKLNMKSPIATYLSKKMSDGVLVIYQRNGKYVDVSFRRGVKSKINLDELSKKTVDKIPGSNAGGHMQASGARFPVKYLNLFLTNIKRCV